MRLTSTQLPTCGIASQPSSAQRHARPSGRCPSGHLGGGAQHAGATRRLHEHHWHLSVRSTLASQWVVAKVVASAA
jgi:hypothetical protein